MTNACWLVLTNTPGMAAYSSWEHSRRASLALQSLHAGHTPGSVTRLLSLSFSFINTRGFVSKTNIKKFSHGWNSDGFKMWTDYKDCRVFQSLTKQGTWEQPAAQPLWISTLSLRFPVLGLTRSPLWLKGTIHTRTVQMAEGQRARTSLGSRNSPTEPCSWITTCM